MNANKQLIYTVGNVGSYTPSYGLDNGMLFMKGCVFAEPIEIVYTSSGDITANNFNHSILPQNAVSGVYELGLFLKLKDETRPNEEPRANYVAHYGIMELGVYAECVKIYRSMYADTKTSATTDFFKHYKRSPLVLTNFPHLEFEEGSRNKHEANTQIAQLCADLQRPPFFAFMQFENEHNQKIRKLAEKTVGFGWGHCGIFQRGFGARGIQNFSLFAKMSDKHVGRFYCEDCQVPPNPRVF